jgi:hypothetical protein
VVVIAPLCGCEHLENATGCAGPAVAAVLDTR